MKKSKKMKEQELQKILSTVDEKSRKATLFHLEMVKKTTGEILLEDVEYCLRLNDRVQEHAKRTGTNPLPGFL
jgi:hypothetical protein